MQFSLNSSSSDLHSILYFHNQQFFPHIPQRCDSVGKKYMLLSIQTIEIELTSSENLNTKKKENNILQYQSEHLGDRTCLLSVWGLVCDEG